LNDGAKGFLNGPTIGPLLLTAPGIQVHQVTPEQLLAMKLSAWRDDTDINDARRLLLEFPDLELKALWARIEPFVIRGEELKARYIMERTPNLTRAITQAALKRESLRLRELVLELLRSELDLSLIALLENASVQERAVLAGILELLALRRGMIAPS
jgi:predicted nucleotidyltransferase